MCVCVLCNASLSLPQDELRKLLWARELTAEGVARSIVNVLKPLFPAPNLDHYLAMKGAASVWQLRALLLALPHLPKPHAPLPRGVAYVPKPTPIGAGGVKAELPAWDLNDLNKALAIALGRPSPKPPETEHPVATPWSSQKQVTTVPTPARAVVVHAKNTIACKREPSPTGRDASPTPPPWTRRSRRRMTARKAIVESSETGDPFLIPMSAPSTQTWQPEHQHAPEANPALPATDDQLESAMEVLAEASSSELWAEPVL